MDSAGLVSQTIVDGVKTEEIEVFRAAARIMALLPPDPRLAMLVMNTAATWFEAYIKALGVV